MTLFTLLLVLIFERGFKTGEHWQLDHCFEPLFQRIKRYNTAITVIITAVFMAVVGGVMHLLDGVFFNLPLLGFWLALGLFCIGAGPVRQHYHAYLRAASHDDAHACDAMASELTLIHGVQPDCDQRTFLTTLQNALLWINYRFYLAPLFWFVLGAGWGPILLAGYAFLRAWQTWLARHASAHQRLKSGVDGLLHLLDWVPVRLVGIVYALLGHGERALPAWFGYLTDIRTSQYAVLTALAQYSLARDPHDSPVDTPKAAVAMAKKVSMVIVVVVAILTIYGALV